MKRFRAAPVLSDYPPSPPGTVLSSASGASQPNSASRSLFLHAGLHRSRTVVLVPWAISLLIVFALTLAMPRAALSGQITINVHGLPPTAAALLALSGEKTTFVDSIKSDALGMFHFSLGAKHHPGLYRLAFGKRAEIEFVHENEDVEITTDTRGIIDSLKVVRSQSNSVYYTFRRLNQGYKTKSELLQLVLARYPRDDAYYVATLRAASDLQADYFARVRTDAGSSSFTSRYIRSARLPVVDLAEPPEKQLAYLKAHALDHVDFTDESLVHSDLFTSKAIEYLTYYREPRLPRELLAKEFNTAADSILNRAKVNPTIYRQITEYLISGFKQYGFEECINHILDNYVIKDDLCLDESGTTIQKMIDQKKQLRPGVRAPEITLPDTSGRPVSLTQIASERTIVLFYSTTCPHCQSVIPRLSALANGKSSTLRVLAVSLDSSVAAWRGYVTMQSLEWIHVIEAGGWSGTAAKDYFVYATPTMILLDRDKTVIGVPMTLGELQKLL